MEINLTDELIYKLKVISRHFRILIIENDLKLSKELYEIFKCFFIHIDMATDGLEGLELYKQNRYDIVVSEFDTLNIEGKELLKSIRNIYNKQMVIVLGDCVKTNIINANKVISKPYKLEKLLKVLLKCSEDILQQNNEKEIKVKNALFNNTINTNQEIKILFSNIEHLNSRFYQGINYIQSNYYVNNVIKTIASIFNGYYQNFSLIGEVNCLANLFLKISAKFYKGNFGSTPLDSLTIQVIIEFLYIEIMNLQYELLTINKKKDIQYIKTTFESSILMILDKLEKNYGTNSLSYELNYNLSK